MRNFAPCLAVAIGLTAMPAFAGSPDAAARPMQLAQLNVQGPIAGIETAIGGIITATVMIGTAAAT